MKMKTLFAILLLTLAISSTPLSPVSAAEEAGAPDSKIDPGVFLDKSLFTHKCQTLVEKWGCRISTVAGTGVAGFSGDDDPAISAQLNRPSGVGVSPSGVLYIADNLNHRVRKVENGVITTVAGNGITGFLGDGGKAKETPVAYPTDVAVDMEGNIYIAQGSKKGLIRKVDTADIIHPFAGFSGPYSLSVTEGPATQVILNQPSSVAISPTTGELHIAEVGDRRIRKVASGYMSIVAGNGWKGFSGEGGNAKAARLNDPYGVAIDGHGNIYIADTFNHRIRKVTTAGIISTFAGTGVQGFSGDGGPAVDAALSHPTGVAVGPSGVIYIVDAVNHRVRVTRPYIDEICTIAGTGVPDWGGDGGSSYSAPLNQPHDVAVDAAGNIFIADGGNNRIRKVTCAQREVLDVMDGEPPAMRPTKTIRTFQQLEQ